MTSHAIQEEITPRTECAKAGGGDYDVYYDANISEVVQCLPVLQRLTARVQALQNDWPDHPTLKQVSQSTTNFQTGKSDDTFKSHVATQADKPLYTNR